MLPPGVKVFHSFPQVGFKAFKPSLQVVIQLLLFLLYPILVQYAMIHHDSETGQIPLILQLSLTMQMQEKQTDEVIIDATRSVHGKQAA